MNGSFTVKKVLNNNVLIASHHKYSEVVLIGKGIGFGKKQDDVIEDKGYDKMFILKDEKEQKQFKSSLTMLMKSSLIFQTMSSITSVIGQTTH